jgi:hypothetical protein
MRHIISSLALVGFLGLPGGSGLVRAQVIQPAQPQFEQMTDEKLTTWMRNLGYTVEEKSNTQGQRYWSVQYQNDGWSYLVELSPYRNNNGQINGFWLISKLGKPLDPNHLPTAQTLLNVLERNHTIVPYFFSFHRQSNYLCLNYEHPYSTSHQDQIKTLFTNFFNKTRETQTVWTVAPAPAANTAGNPGGSDKPAAGNLGGTTWAGTENLQGFGKLSFKFNANGSCSMTDPNSTVQGTWSQNGNQVTITFTHCVYTGTIEGRTLSGNARSNIGQTWTFNVKMQK